MALTAQQINALLNKARLEGMSAAELEGLRDVLMNRARKPNAAEKLSMAINTMPKDQRDILAESLSELDAITDKVAARGRAALEAMSDDEWDALVDEANNVIT